MKKVFRRIILFSVLFALISSMIILFYYNVNVTQTVQIGEYYKSSGTYPVAIYLFLPVLLLLLIIYEEMKGRNW